MYRKPCLYTTQAMLTAGERLNNSVVQALTEAEEFLMETTSSSERATQITQV